MRVFEAYESERKIRELRHLRARVTLTFDAGAPVGAREQIEALFAREEIIVLKKKKKEGFVPENIRPMIVSMDVTQPDETHIVLEPSLNPEYLLRAMENELPDDSLMPEIELPEIDIEELRLAAQERRSQLPLHKLKEKLANGDASADTGETAEEAAEEEAAQEAAEPIIEAPFIFEELPEEKAAEAEALEAEMAEAIAESAAKAVQDAEPAADEAPANGEKAGETEDAEDVVKV